MSTLMIKDQKVYAGAYNITGDIKGLSLGISAEPLDSETLGDSTRTKIKGMEDASLDYDGNYSAGAGLVETTEYADIGAAARVVSVCVQAGADGELAYSFKGQKTGFEVGGGVGEILAFNSAGLVGASPVMRGTILHAATAVTSSDDGTGRQVGAIAAGGAGYAALHVIAASGTNPTLDVVIDSDDADDFVGSTERIAFTRATAVTSEWKSVAGAVTDDWWRASWTVGGTDTPTFTFIVVFGIRI